MKKITLVLSGLMMLAASAIISSCDKSGEPAPSVNEGAETAKTAKAGGSYKIAFVLIDTLTSQYQKCKDLEEEFAKKRANAESTIQDKGKSFAAQAQEFQRKYQSNQFTQQQFEAEQARLGKLQQDIEALQARLSNSLQEEYQKEFQALTDTIQNFTKSYAKEKGFDFILCKSSGIDNVLYANEAYDVTEEVVNALNKRYSKAPKKDAKKEEAKK
ncbi:MAG: OmpH family outer membrane protein [Prevotellaceae bacterium]|nr:OmpH family outer membrane protein [Candidatus Minthosoma equi]